MPRASALKPDGSVKGVVHLALFDILGYRRILQSSSLEDLEKAFGPWSAFAWDGASAAAASELPHISGFQPAPCITIRFADTVLLCSPDRTERGLVSIVFASLALLSASAGRAIPLRGAITRGEFIMSADRQFYAGPALAVAYEIERRQEWMGAVLDKTRINLANLKSLSAESIRDLMLVPYAAPFKEGPIGIHPCVNWPPFYARALPNIEETLRTSARDADWGAQRKIENTLRFYDFATRRWVQEHGELRSQPAPAIEARLAKRHKAFLAKRMPKEGP